MWNRGLRIGMVTVVIGVLLVLVTACSAGMASVAAPGVALASQSAQATPDEPGAPVRRPNIVFILTDDLDVNLDSLNPTYMPRIKSLLTDQGTTFENHFVSLSLCCPSRATTLKGEYAHNTDIFNNSTTASDGGFNTFYKNGEEASTVATWLQDAGYRTVLMGKYLNGYPVGKDQNGNPTPPNYVPPGWSQWYSPEAGDPYGEYNYTMNENGTPVVYNNTYMVDVLSGKAQTFIQQAAHDDTPFFMYIAPYDPHQPAAAAPRYQHDFLNVPLPRPPSFNEKDVSDKPSWIQARPPLTNRQINDMTQLYDKRLQAMEAVEDMLQNVVDTLAATHQLDNTYIVFTSDNGFHMGEHRLPAGKNTLYEEDLHVPLIVRGPGVAKGGTVTAITANVDYAPTFADLAGATVPATVDGRSLVPLLHGHTPSDWRNALLLEHGGPDLQVTAQGAGFAGDPNTLEPPDQMDLVDKAAKGKFNIPPFVGVRTADLAFAEYETNTSQPVRELYNLRCDPHELKNIADDPANQALVSQLSAWSRALHQCAGATCRTIEAQPPVAAPICPAPTR